MADVKVNYKVTDAITIQIEAASVLDAVQAIGDYQVLAKRPCGLCKSNNTGPTHKVAKGYDFYEHKCFDCGASLPMGQFKERDALFVKESEGWKKWEKGEQSSGGQRSSSGSMKEQEDFF